jgi:hypothetical protein
MAKPSNQFPVEKLMEQDENEKFETPPSEFVKMWSSYFKKIAGDHQQSEDKGGGDHLQPEAKEGDNHDYGS